MKWKQVEFKNEKIVSGFLFFPKTIDGETRWLEFAKWKKKFFGDGGGMMGGAWFDQEWIDE